MSSIIVKRSWREEFVEYTLSFASLDCPGSGFSFECDENGNIDREQLDPCAIPNLERCLALDGVRAEGVVKREWAYRHPAEGKCSCGRTVYLCGFTNTCKCGRDYNSCGYLLAPRSQWGEETGEHVADILRIA